MAAKNTGGLGKGLDLLFGTAEAVETAENITRLSIHQIEPNREQPRRSFDEEALSVLAESIRQHGVITPLAVRKIDENRYQIVAGERRYRASRMAGLDELPVVILEASDLEALEMALVENLQREDLSPIEEAEAYRVLIEQYGLTQEQAAERVGRSRPAVANALRLLELPEDIKHMIASGTLSAGHGRALLPIKSERDRTQAAETVVARGLSVRQTEQWVKRLLAEEKPPKKQEVVDYAKELSAKLAGGLGRGVQVLPGRGGRGRIVLEYYDLDDLDHLLAQLGQSTDTD